MDLPNYFYEEIRFSGNIDICHLLDENGKTLHSLGLSVVATIGFTTVKRFAKEMECIVTIKGLRN